MTLPQPDTPLRKSAVANYRESVDRILTVVNDDEAERREARRRTLLEQPQMRPSILPESIEDNETILQCLEIYNGNKLSRENAWSVSLIDTLDKLLDRHHKSLSNFKFAGSSLEASSKVYGLRVDSIYLDTMRMAAGLNARKLTDKELNAADNEDNVDGRGDAPAAQAEGAEDAAPKPKKRARKAVATVTKNKDTISARLDSVPLPDPLFGKLNSTVGSINASNRLMHNILPTQDSELLLSSSYRFWKRSEIREDIEDFTEIVRPSEFPAPELVNATWAQKLKDRTSQLSLRALHSGYIISDTAQEREKPNNNDRALNSDGDNDNADNDHFDNANDDFYDNPKELSMAFDINAVCEPMPDLTSQPPILDGDFNDLEELTTEDQAALQRCQGLRKQQLIIEDLRPVDAHSKLEYSYRPMENISQYWAGPSHWKFRRTQNRITLGQANTQNASAIEVAAARRKRAQQMAEKRRSRQLNFSECHDSLFLPLESNTKLRKANYQKKWDPRKLVLPTKFHLEPNFFFKYDHAPSIRVTHRFGEADDDNNDGYDDDGQILGGGDHDAGRDDTELFDNEHFVTDQPEGDIADEEDAMQPDGGAGGNSGSMNTTVRNPANDTVLEIAMQFENAPTQVTRVVVPYARRAKVIDMKGLKRGCNSLIQKQFLTNVNDIETMATQHPVHKAENYKGGVSHFKQIYDDLPSVLSTKMSESLSTSVALYAVLHLANEQRLRLIPHEDLKDFEIRQLGQ